MNRTLIIGASGQIGKHLTKKMLDDNHSVVALVRDKQKLSDLNSESLTIVEHDLNTDFSSAFAECSNVVFVAGSGPDTGPDKTVLIDLWAACRAADYAKSHNVKHFIMISSIGADDPLSAAEDMQPYLVAKHMADEHLINSGLHYSIIRPGALTNDQSKATFTSERPKHESEAVIAREDVALALLYRINNPLEVNSITELFNGNNSIDEALNGDSIERLVVT